VRYVTERAVFELTRDGLQLIEMAQGVDLNSQILSLMPFSPALPAQVPLMPPSCLDPS
jgi:propionate CoA-transferase